MNLISPAVSLINDHLLNPISQLSTQWPETLQALSPDLSDTKTVKINQSKFDGITAQRLLTARRFTSGTIIVTVCKSWSCRSDLKENSTVHKCVLYSEEQFDEECVINEDKSVELEADPEDFKAYMQWLYIRRLPENVADSRQDTQSNLNWLTISYGLACIFGDPRYQDVLVNRMLWCVREIDSFPNTQFVCSLYFETESLSTDVLGRKLMVDLWAWEARPEWEWIDSLNKVVCTEFVGQLCAALMDHRNTPSGELVEPWARYRADQYLVGVRCHE
jgi:hypothetical protein